MNGDWADDRNHLLRVLQRFGDSGRAEGAPADRIGIGYFPVPDHLRLLDPDVVLVVGPRGSGKSEIATVLTDADLFETIKNYAPAVRLPQGRCEWLKVFPAEARGIEPIGLRSFFQGTGGGAESAREFWFAYLVRALRLRLDPTSEAELKPLFSPPAPDIVSVHAAFKSVGIKSVTALDALDARLERENRYIFVTFDELDTFGAGDWSIIEAGVRGLVAFWAAYARRWRRLRAKIFLRTDLYERHAKTGGADLAKLAAGRVELVWSDRDLYGMLMKRIANADDSFSKYTQAGKAIQWKADDRLGKIPILRSPQDARPVVEKMIGIYMGANRKKGLVYRWLLDHVRDGQGRGYPRPFVRLLEEAASQELTHFANARLRRLLSPASLRRALDRVSNDHVVDSKDEWTWLDLIKERLSSDPLVPYTQKEAVKLLSDLPEEGSTTLPPFEGRDMLNYLVELGVFRRRPDSRFDVPDLYLAGLGLRRKGGVTKS